MEQSPGPATSAAPAIARKRIALVAHDNRKRDMVEWVEWNYRGLTGHALVCTGTTGRLVEAALRDKLEKDGCLDWAADLKLLAPPGSADVGPNSRFAFPTAHGQSQTRRSR